MMDDCLDFCEFVIGFILNNCGCQQYDQETKFNLRLGVWILFQFGLLTYYIVDLMSFHNLDDKTILPALAYCFLSTYYIQSCEEEYIYHGKLDMYKRQKKLKIIDFLQNMIVLTLLLLKRFKENEETQTNLALIILIGIDSALGVIEFIKLVYNKKEYSNDSFGGTKCMYYGIIFGVVPSLVAWIIVFPPNQLFSFKPEYWYSYAHTFALILILLVCLFKIYRYKKPKELREKTRTSKQFLLFVYGFTQGAYQLFVAVVNVAYQIVKQIYRKCKI